jgi:hypothetical protein
MGEPVDLSLSEFRWGRSNTQITERDIAASHLDSLTGNWDSIIHQRNAGESGGKLRTFPSFRYFAFLQK